MKNHLVSDSFCIAVNLCPPKYLQGTTNNVGLTISGRDTLYGLQLALSKTIRIGDTKYHI